MSEYHFTVVYERDEEGRILAICPALQGCYADGESLAEAKSNILEAIEAHIESRIKHDEPIYPEISSEPVTLTL